MRTDSTPNTLNIIQPASRTAVTYSEVVDATGFDKVTIIQSIGAFSSGTATGTFYYGTSAADLSAYQYLTAGDTWVGHRQGATDNVCLAHGFTTAVGSTPTIYQATFRLKQVGTLSSGDYIWCTIEADSSGPDGTAIATSYKVDATSITTASAGQLVTFTFRESSIQYLAASTKYYVVLNGDYTTSTSNYIAMHVDTVASGGTLYIKDSTYSNITTQSPPTTCLAISTWTADTDYNATAVTADQIGVPAYCNQEIVVNTAYRGPYIQWYLAETSAWTGLLATVQAVKMDPKYAT